MLLQLLLSGIAQGSIYALVALSMTALFRTTTIVNFGQGEFFMFGAFAVYVVMTVGGLPFLPAALLSIITAFVLGVLFERLLIRPMGDASHLALAMMTVALSFLLRGVARFFWGREVLPMPPVFSFPPIEVGELIVTTQDLLIGGTTLFFLILFFLFFNRTKLGRVARAVASNPRGAALVGVNMPAFQSVIWGFAAALGALAGILVAPITLLYPDMGASVLIRAFAAMTLGGFGHPVGAVVGGLLIGVLEQLSGGYLSTALIDIFAFLVIIAVLIVRPSGLLGTREVLRV
jgi:branched-chain amino acid transport system permease protein